MAPSPHTQPTVSIVVRPETHSAWIRLVGDIDMAAQPALTEAAEQLHGRALQLIAIDLTAATFVCSTFANYLATVHRDHPYAELVLHDPASIARVIIVVTGLDAFVARVEPPCPHR